jgi:hypothetical protein
MIGVSVGGKPSGHEKIGGRGKFPSHGRCQLVSEYVPRCQGKIAMTSAQDLPSPLRDRSRARLGDLDARSTPR